MKKLAIQPSATQQAHAGGLDLAVGELNTRPGMAMLHSGGGALEVGGLDGSASLHSQGGPLQVGLPDRLACVLAPSKAFSIAIFRKASEDCKPRTLCRSTVHVKQHLQGALLYSDPARSSAEPGPMPILREGWNSSTVCSRFGLVIVQQKILVS